MQGLDEGRLFLLVLGEESGVGRQGEMRHEEGEEGAGLLPGPADSPAAHRSLVWAANLSQQIAM